MHYLRITIRQKGKKLRYTRYLIAFVLSLAVLLLPSCEYLLLDSANYRPGFTLYERKGGVNYVDIAAFGDQGSGEYGQRVVSESLSTYATDIPLDLVLLLGDNNYGGGFQSVNDYAWRILFEDMYDPARLNIPFYAVLGNHDYYNGDEDCEIDYTEHSSRWRMPSKYYSFKYTIPNETTEIEFFALETTPIHENSTLGPSELAQLNWLATALSSSTARWKIVFGHHPIYSNGDHGGSERVRSAVEQILIDNGVDLYLAGHDHNLEILEPVNGVHYVVSGAGAGIRSYQHGDNTIYGASLLGFMALRISYEEIVIMSVLINSVIDYCMVISK
jgi:acid phosphatase